MSAPRLLAILRGEAPARHARGVTLIELVIAVAIVAILIRIALPSYQQYTIRASRSAAQSELVELAGLQDRIYLTSGAYSSNVSTAYTGLSTGGLGVTSGRSRDGRYAYSVTVSGASYTLTATPVTGSTQAGDGNLTINSQGQRTWGTSSW